MAFRIYSFYIFAVCYLFLDTSSSYGALRDSVFSLDQPIPPKGIYLGEYTQVLSDSTDAQIADILNGLTGPFKSYNRTTQSFNPDYTTWVKLTLTNQGVFAINSVFSMGENNYATMYVVKNGVIVGTQQSGELVKGKDKDLNFGRKESFFPLVIAPSDTLMLVFKLHNLTKFPTEVNPIIFDRNGWSKATNRQILIEALYQGFLWVLICYSLTFYWKVRDTTYLYFGLYVLSFALYFSWFKGLLHQYVLPDTPFFNIHIWLISGLIPVLYQLFLRQFLHTPKLIPYWDKWLKWLIRIDLLVFIIACLTFFTTFNRPLAVAFINNTGLINGLFGLWILYVLFKTKNVLARYFVFGSLMLVCFVLLAIISYQYFKYQGAVYYLMVGSSIELVVFSLGLAKRIEILIDKKKEADERLIAELKRNERLQEEVKEALSKTIDRQEDELVNKNKELNIAVDKLRSINKELQSFAYTIAHDLRAPLRAVNYFASLLGENEERPLATQDEQNVELLKSQVKKMDRLIQGVLKYSVAASINENLRKIDLNKVMEEIVEVSAPSSGVEISYDRLPEIIGDEIKIHQVFQNLISNALKFVNPLDGKIHVDYKENENFWTICIKDNGKGIKEEDFERIFMIFKTATEFGQSQSTGIGLSIVKKIVELHGGKVWVKSVLDKGATFFFTISKKL